MSITASVVILVVLIARGLMGKLPKRYSYILWGIVAIRLLCPVGIASPISLFNLVGEHTVPLAAYPGDKTTKLESESDLQEENVGKTAGKEENDCLNGKDTTAIQGAGIEKNENSISQNNSEDKFQKSLGSENQKNDNVIVKEMNLFVKYGTILWFSICILLAGWNLMLMFRMKKRVATAIRLQDNIYECGQIPSPFVMGVIKPVIYIPFRLSEAEQAYIISHEQYHIKRKDNIVKLIAVLITCVYWFHPLVWIAYMLMIRDMEMSCDEYVLQKSVQDIRVDYSKSLLGFATNQRRLGVGLIAFGESDTRKRVKHVMKFKKCGKWIGMLAVIAIVGVSVICLTDAKINDSVQNADAKINAPVQNADVKIEGSVENTDKKNYTKSLASVFIYDYQVDIMYVSDKKIEEKPETGYYKGKHFVIQTSKEDKVVDQYELSLSSNKDNIMYFPAEGFVLHVEDYDGNGKKDDFALGQGQTEDPILGNFMKYRFFGVKEDGSILGYQVSSTEDGVSIVTVPGEYSPGFQRRDGEVQYSGLSEDGGVEDMSVSIIQCISVKEVNETKTEPEYSLMKSIEKNMPEQVVEELQKHGVWHVSSGGDGMMVYSLANAGVSNDITDITLRLDFCYEGDRLVRYTSKQYGFTEQVNKSTIKDWHSKLTDFAKSFTNVESEYMEESIDKVLHSKKQYPYNIIANSSEVPEHWNDGNHAYFIDTNGSSYVFDTRINMIKDYEWGAAREE